MRLELKVSDPDPLVDLAKNVKRLREEWREETMRAFENAASEYDLEDALKDFCELRCLEEVLEFLQGESRAGA